MDECGPRMMRFAPCSDDDNTSCAARYLHTSRKDAGIKQC